MTTVKRKQLSINKDITRYFKSLGLRPKENSDVLILIAVLRMLAVLGIILRVSFDIAAFSLRVFSPAILVYAILSVVYASSLLLLCIFYRQLFLSQVSKIAQLGTDILLYGIGFSLSESLQSDIYYFTIIPFLIAVEYFSLTVVTYIVIMIMAVHVIVYIAIGQTQDVLSWFIRDFVPRTFIILTMGLPYFVHRRIRVPFDITISQEREVLLKKITVFTTNSSPEHRAEAKELERDLKQYVERNDLIGYLMTREAYARMEEFSEHLLGIQQIASTAIADGSDQYVEVTTQIIDQLGKALNCCAATFRVEEPDAKGISGLMLYHVWGSAVKTKNLLSDRLSLNAKSIVTKAYSTRKVQKWVETKDEAAGNILVNQEFARSCQIRAAISIPIVLSERIYVATFYRSMPKEFDASEQVLILSVMDYVTAIISGMRNLQASRNYSQLLHKRLEISRNFIVGLAQHANEESILEYAVQQAKNQFDAELASVFLMRGERLKRKVDAGVEQGWFVDETYFPGDSVTGRAFSNNHYEIVNHVSESTADGNSIKQYSSKLTSGTLCHILAVPLIGQYGKIGVLRLINKLSNGGEISPSGFSKDDAEILSTLATSVAIAYESSHQLRQLRLLLDLSKDTNKKIGKIQDVLNVICTYACKALNVDQSGLVLYDSMQRYGTVRAQVRKRISETGEMKYQPIYCEDYPQIDLQTMPALQQLIARQESTNILDAQNSSETQGCHESFKKQHIASILMAPLLVDGIVIGDIGFDSLYQRREFTREEMYLAELIAAYGALFIRAASLFQDADQHSRSSERLRIRNDLHDLRSLLGSTVLVDLQLAISKLNDETPRQLKVRLDESFTKAKYINDRILSIMNELHEPVIYKQGVIAAIQHYITKSFGDTPVIFTKMELDRRLEPHIEHVIYRVAQEAIMNAYRHGIKDIKDGLIHVSLHDRVDKIYLIVEDNGCGFDKSTVRSDALGLYIMSLQANDLDGKAELGISSTIGLGTKVSLLIDLSISVEGDYEYKTYD